MVEQEVERPRTAAPRARRQRKLTAEVVTALVAAPATPEQELEQLKQYTRKMSNSSKAEAIAFLQRAGIMDAKGNVKKAYRA